MKNARFLALLFGTFVAGSAMAQQALSGTFEDSYVANKAHKGFALYAAWAELNYHSSDSTTFTLSGLQTLSARLIDEACYAGTSGPSMLRLGRIRTGFGFNNWADIAYTGFNQHPLLLVTPLAGRLALFRDDSGAEYTYSGKYFQVQAAAVDTNLAPDQVLGRQVNHATLRVQTQSGPVILGVDALKGLQNLNDIYGLDLRYTQPHFVMRAEAMQGQGVNGSSGYFADGSYRFPALTRTEFVGRTEGFRYTSLRPTYQQTLGIRQFAGENLTFIVNYAWANGPSAGQPDYGSYAVPGWSFRTMFQVHF